MSLQTAEQYEENEQYTQAYEEYKKLHEKNPKDLNTFQCFLIIKKKPLIFTQKY